MDDPLAGASYLSLRSYKKNGAPVDTPVWFAQVAQKLVVFTNGTSYKVKRIRRDPRVQVARCDVRGKLLGPWQDGTCRPVEKESERDSIAAAYAALNTKYGLMMRLGTFFATLSGRARQRLILEISRTGSG
jgi:PPOX class probable F420-dependent enzyme